MTTVGVFNSYGFLAVWNGDPFEKALIRFAKRYEGQVDKHCVIVDFHNSWRAVLFLTVVNDLIAKHKLALKATIEEHAKEGLVL